MLIEIIFLILLMILISAWIFFFFLINDFSVPTVSLKKFKKILVVFPHPDDELLSVGGVMSIHKRATLLILTKGERGTPDAHLDMNLKAIRTQEEKISSKILNVQTLIQKDYGDGELKNKREAITKEIRKIIIKESPDLIITYDLSGFYGHPDHMVVSEITTNLVKDEFKNIELWYTTISKRVYSLMSLPEHMAKDSNFKSKRTYPTHKVFIGLHVFQKIRATLAQKSQYSWIQGGLPVPIPSVFFHTMTIFEHFHKADGLGGV